MRRALVLVAALGAALWAYQSVWTAGWVYEDPLMRLAAANWQGGWSPRAVTLWTWTLASTPALAHGLNLALHAAVSALLGLCLVRLAFPPLAAWTAGLAWLLHAVPVETAAYAASRGEAIAALGVLLACAAAAGRWWRPLEMAGVVAGALVAVSGKESGIVVAGLVPLVIWLSRHRYPDRPRWAPAWGPAALVLPLGLAVVAWYGGPRAVVNMDGPWYASSRDVRWFEWAWLQSGAVWYWLVATVWPPLLTPDPDVDRIPVIGRVFGLLALAGLASVAWRRRDRDPHLALACGWVLVGLSLRFVVQTPRSYLNAHHLYLPWMGFAMAGGLGVDRLRALWTPHKGEARHGEVSCA